MADEWPTSGSPRGVAAHIRSSSGQDAGWAPAPVGRRQTPRGILLVALNRHNAGVLRPAVLASVIAVTAACSGGGHAAPTSRSTPQPPATTSQPHPRSDC